MFDRIYFPNLFSKFSTVLILALLLFAASCTTSHKVKNSAKNAINLDTISINATKEKGIYHGSETRLSDIIHTRIEVKFDWAKQYLYGKAYITAKPYFYPLNTVRLNARGMDINEVDLLNGETKIKANYVYKGDVLLITLDKEYSSKDTFKLFIDYTAKPNELKTKGGSEAIKDDKGLYFINPEGTDKNKPMQIWTQGETQSNSVWFPCVDSPNEKMTNEVFITVDRKYTTLSNGALFSQTENADGTRTDYWRMSLPHSTYLVMMAIGEFSIVKDHWRDREVNYYMEKEFEPYAKNIFGNTPEMIEAFSKKLGVNYPWNKYSQIIVRDYVSGAMENTTATLHGDFMNQTDRELLDRNYEDVISHELFHQWFGDLVTCESWSNIPLNESFADYGEYIWREFKYGRDEADALRHKSLNKYFRNSKGQQTDIVRYFYNKQEDLFDVHTYEKGGCVLHMLRKYVGDEAFYTALKLYLETNKFGNAEMADLRMAFEKVTGEDLNWFFNQWFFASGHPELVITHQYDTTTQKYTVTIEQKQNLKTTPLYKIPMDIDIYSGEKTERKRIVLEEQKQNFEFALASKPDFVNVDAEKMLLGIKTESGKNSSDYSFQFFHAPLYEDKSEALKELFKTPKSNEYKKCIFSALSDKCWEIRMLALSGLEEIMDSNRDTIKSKLITLARNDSKATIRSAALALLSGSYNDNDLMLLYKDALSDRSFTVMSDALAAIAKHDSAEAIRIAPTFENEKNKQLLTELMDIYTRNGTDANNDFFIKAVNQFTGYWKITYVSMYADFLKRCSDESINKALPIIESIARDADKYINFGGQRAMKDIVEMYQEREKKLAVKLKSAAIADQSVINAEITQVKNQQKKINNLLDSMQQKK